ncbi:phosphotransferase enzyme family protein [Gorillibacterium timonense]|uniref:phosphotransferase enzyme family protein n=1 Tax=Gorillibacterium timonense TaxID=1689269 RepID=UPI00071D46C8|nr:phosphotransferase [Gorillibacterium timonense]
MKEALFPVRYTQLHPDALKKELAARYEWKEPIECRLFDSGINDIYVVSAGDKRCFLRVALTGRYERKDYEEEVAIINTLSDQGIPVAKPIRCKDSSLLWEIHAPEGIRHAILFAEAKHAPSEDKAKQAHQLGSTLAQLHAIADEQTFTVSRPAIDLQQLIEEPLKKVKPYFERRSSDYLYFKNAAEQLGRAVERKLGYEMPYYGYCHGDIHGGNVHFVQEQPVLFDFDCMGYGWRAYDICVFAWNETFGDEAYVQSEAWTAFLSGYLSVRPLSKMEVESIPAFAALRDLWLMSLHADVIERNAGCSWYNDGYLDYRLRIFKLWYERAAAFLTD